jgi:hypothetical protein
VTGIGTRFTVPRSTSMLDALIEACVDVTYSRRGECWLCAVTGTDIEGWIDHRDVLLSPLQRSADRKRCTCVSRVVGGGITVDTALRAAP